MLLGCKTFNWTIKIADKRILVWPIYNSIANISIIVSPYLVRRSVSRSQHAESVDKTNYRSVKLFDLHFLWFTLWLIMMPDTRYLLHICIYRIRWNNILKHIMDQSYPIESKHKTATDIRNQITKHYNSIVFNISLSTIIAHQISNFKNLSQIFRNEKLPSSCL